jgi:hypothetical protein
MCNDKSTSSTLVCVLEEDILPIRLIHIHQLLLLQAFLVLIHSFKRLPVLLIQSVVAISQRKADEYLTCQHYHNTDLDTIIPGACDERRVCVLGMLPTQNVIRVMELTTTFLLWPA